MRIELLEPVTIRGQERTPDQGPIGVDDDLAVLLVAQGKAKGLDGPIADCMIRDAAKKAPAESADASSCACAAGSAPELWVVIPTKGRGADLDRTLAAIFFEAPPLGGLVVVNDGADKATRDVVDAWRQKAGGKLRYIESADREGVAAARIRGNAEVPESAVVVEIDDHDAPEPGALGLIASAFASPEVQAVYGDKFVLDHAGRIVRRVARADYRSGMFREHGNQASGIRAYRKSLYTAVRGRRPEEKLASEYALFLRFEAHLNGKGIHHIAAPLCRWPCVGDGISVRYQAEQAKAADHYAYLAATGALFPPREGAGPYRAEGIPPAFLLDGQPVRAFPISSPAADVSVVVPCYGSTEHAPRLARSLAADGFQGSREIVWVIDADGAAYPTLPGKVVTRGTRRGFAGACNTGARHARGRHVCLLNADTTVEPGWLDAMVEVLEANPGVGAVGPTILDASGQVDSMGSEFDRAFGTFRHIGSADADPRRDMMTGACLLVRRSLWDALGGLDQAYKLGYWEDTDLCMRIRRAGYEIRHAAGALIRHEGGHSKLGQAHPEYQANRQRFHEQWVETGMVDKFARRRGRKVHSGDVCVCIIALNEAEYIGACIESVYPLADRIIVVEGGNAFSANLGACDAKGRSIDRTADAIQDFRDHADPRGIVEFLQPDKPWQDKTEARQFYLDMLKPGDWCLALDADEVLWDAGLWRLSELMHRLDYVSFGLETFWRDFHTVGRGRWRDFFFNMRCFRVREGYRYGTHLRVLNAAGLPIDRDPGVRTHREPGPLAAHYAWVKPMHKIRQKLDYYRRQCRDRFIPPDYVERIFLGYGLDRDAVNKIGTHPMGRGTCEPWSGRHPEAIQRRLDAGLFGWVREVEE